MRLPSRAPAGVIPLDLVRGADRAVRVVAGASAAEGFVGTRSLGMGETLRGAATVGHRAAAQPVGDVAHPVVQRRGRLLLRAQRRQPVPARVDRRFDLGLQGRGRPLLHLSHRQPRRSRRRAMGTRSGSRCRCRSASTSSSARPAKYFLLVGRPDVARGWHRGLHLRRRHHPAAGQRAVDRRRRLQPARPERRRGAAGGRLRRGAVAHRHPAASRSTA